MNFGLTFFALTYIVFLLVPGTFFKRFYYQSKFQQQFTIGSFADKFITSIFWGFIIQLLSISIFKFIFDFNFEQIYIRACNLHESIANNKLPKLSYLQLKYLLGLLCLSMFISCFLGHITHKLLRFFKLDVLFSPLRFSNEWNYIFRNELSQKDFKFEDHTKSYHSTEVDVIVNDSKDDKPNFYSGVLQDYHLDNDGKLDRVCLRLTKKRVKDDKGIAEFREVIGDSFIIPYDNIANMNLRFNYTYKKSTSIIPVSVKSTILLIYMLILFGILILPWFAPVSLAGKFTSILSFLIAWILILVIVSDILDEKRVFTMRQYIFYLICSLISIISGLSILKILNIIEYLK